MSKFIKVTAENIATIASHVKRVLAKHNYWKSYSKYPDEISMYNFHKIHGTDATKKIGETIFPLVLTSMYVYFDFSRCLLRHEKSPSDRKQTVYINYMDRTHGGVLIKEGEWIKINGNRIVVKGVNYINNNSIKIFEVSDSETVISKIKQYEMEAYEYDELMNDFYTIKHINDENEL